MIDLRENLEQLESRLHDELSSLKMMIQTLLPQGHRQQYYQPPPPPPQYRQNENHFNRNYDTRHYDDYRPDYSPRGTPYPQQNYINPQQHRKEVSTPKTWTTQKQFVSLANPLTTTTEAETTTATKQPEVVVMRNKLKSLDTVKGKSSTTTTTEAPEIIPSKNEYTYYWKLDNFPKVFSSAKKHEVFSHVFNVKGLFLRIRAVLNHRESENLVLDIEHLANIDEGDKMEIEISDGLVFKEIAEENLFQYSFAIIDQTRPNHDLISPIFWNTDSDNFLIPNSVYLLANYLKSESLLIKLIITF
jgi:hypothetical protein